MTNHQALKWFMESNWLMRKLTKLVPIFQEYDYDVTHCIGINNKHVNGLNWNRSSNELDTTSGMLAWGNKFKNSGAWLACCFILLHFGKWLLKSIMLSSS